MAKAQKALGMSVRQLRRHEYCLGNALTNDECNIVIAHLRALIETRPDDWRFDDAVASIDGVAIKLYPSIDYCCLVRPVNLGAWYGAPIADLVAALHALRHRNGNHLTRALAETAGIDFSAAHGLSSAEIAVERLQAGLDQAAPTRRAKLVQATLVAAIAAVGIVSALI